MTKDNKVPETFNFDTRLIERNLRNGRLDQSDYEAFLKKLADDEANAQYIETFELDPSDATAASPESLTFT